MLEASEAFKAAVVADVRHMVPRVTIQVIPPTTEYQHVGKSNISMYSQNVLAQMTDKSIENPQPFATLEHNRWTLDGTFRLYDGSPSSAPNAAGTMSDSLSGADGLFDDPVVLTLYFSGIDEMTACCVFFAYGTEGWPTSYAVEILRGETVVYTESVENNTASSIMLTGLQIASPDAVRVTITAWSLPDYRARITEMCPGLLQIWTEHDMISMTAIQQTDLSALSTPYGTCTLSFYNPDSLFDPEDPNGYFYALEQKQAVKIEIGAVLPSGDREFFSVGTYYQTDMGWKVSADGMTQSWELWDIIGMLKNIPYQVKTPYPTDLQEWMQSLLAHLGDTFVNRYTIDFGASRAIYDALGNNPNALDGKTCGEVLAYICQAVRCFACADAATGFLRLRNVDFEGSQVTMDNLSAFPAIKANEKLSRITYTTEKDGVQTTRAYATGIRGATKEVQSGNPFAVQSGEINPADMAAYSAEYYGGNTVEGVGRGDPATELGDFDTIQTRRNKTAQGYRSSQSYKFVDGVLRDCQVVLTQKNNVTMIEA